MVSLIPRFAPGTVLADRFEVEDLIGHGSMGSVYAVKDRQGGGRLALKVVNLDALGDPRAARRFEREAAAGLRIQSEHVARTVAAGAIESANLVWLAMELVEGRELGAYVAERAPLDPELAREIVSQLLDAVSAAHEVGVVHRDLKPENVRIAERDGSVELKVLDFGIAKALGPSTLSGTSPGLGTPLWTAPEQSKDGYAPAPNADVWALGLVAFYVLTGKIYWARANDRSSVMDLAIELMQSPIAPASLRAKELGAGDALPAGFDAWFSRAVHRDPAERFRDAGEARRAFEALFVAPVTSERDSPVVTRPGYFLALLILSCVATGYAIYWLLKSGAF